MNLPKIYNLLLYFILFLTISFGVHLSFVNNYGWDWDTYGMINTFHNILEKNIYIKSRGTGYIVPELGIGFLSYFFGSFVTNLFCFALLIFGLFFFYASFEKKKKQKEFLFFLLFCLSNYIILGDSTVPMDYSWSFCFFSLGLFFYSKNKSELAIIFWCLCIGSRLNYIIFIIPSVLLLKNNLKYKLKILIIICTIFFGGLFYLPSWFSSGFTLDFIFTRQWYNHYRPDALLSYLGIGKFLYKVFLSIGYLSLVVIIFNFVYLKFKNNLIFFLTYKLLNTLILLNLILYFFFPWQQAHLWIFIISLYYLLIKYFNFKVISILIVLNISYWLVEFHPITVKRVKHECFNEMIGYVFKPELKKGFVFDTIDRRKWILCYPGIDFPILLKYEKQLQNGLRIK